MRSLAILIMIGVQGKPISENDCVEVNEKHLLHPVPSALIREHCHRSLEMINTRPWATDFGLAKDLILNDVVPFTVLTEPPFLNQTKRSLLADFVDYITSACEDILCVAQELNDKVWNVREPPIVFQPAPPNELNSYSVEDTWDSGNGSCTAMSVFLVTALRLAGAPARIAGTPHWNLGPEKCPHGDSSAACGNHNWVEVYIPDRGWSFVDQRRPDKRVLPLNQSWFAPEWLRGLDRTLNHSVFAASFIPPPELEQYPRGADVRVASYYPMVWDWGNQKIAAWDMSAVYSVEDTPVTVIETS